MFEKKLRVSSSDSRLLFELDPNYVEDEIKCEEEKVGEEKNLQRALNSNGREANDRDVDGDENTPSSKSKGNGK